MKRIVSSLSAALCLLALSLMLFQPYPARTARAADIHERCSDCLQRTQQHYEECQARFGLDIRCDEQFNRDIVNCYRQFCEQ